jgi:hypothetical protein
MYISVDQEQAEEGMVLALMEYWEVIADNPKKAG